MKGSRLFGLSMIALLLGLAAPLRTACAATIVYDGLDTTTHDAWRSTSVAKPALFDPNGDNAYGSDGYYIGYANSGTTMSIMSSLPGYIQSVTPNPIPTLYSRAYSLYGKLDDPSQPIASTVADLPETGIWYQQNGDFFTVTLASAAQFELAVIVDTHNVSNANSGSVTVTGPGGISAQTSLTPIGGAAWYAFFDLSGNTGDSFVVSMTRVAGGSYATTSGIAFEAIPEPASLALLGLGGGLFLRRRRQGV